MREAKRRGTKLYYTDETWLNSGHAFSREWVDAEGLGRQSKVAPGKGSRLIITDIGSETGFLEGGFLAFRSNTTGDYHEEMNGDRYIYLSQYITIYITFENNFLNWSNNHLIGLIEFGFYNVIWAASTV